MASRWDAGNADGTWTHCTAYRRFGSSPAAAYRAV